MCDSCIRPLVYSNNLPRPLSTPSTAYSRLVFITNTDQYCSCRTPCVVAMSPTRYSPHSHDHPAVAFRVVAQVRPAEADLCAGLHLRLRLNRIRRLVQQHQFPALQGSTLARVFARGDAMAASYVHGGFQRRACNSEEKSDNVLVLLLRYILAAEDTHRNATNL